MMYLDGILKNILISKNINFWLKYRNYFKHTFKGINENFDKVINLIELHHSRYDLVLNRDNIKPLLSVKGFEDCLKYVSSVIENNSLNLELSLDGFITFLEISKVSCLMDKSLNFVNDTTEKYSLLKKTENNLSSFIDERLFQLVELKDSLNEENKASEYLLYGDQGVESFKEEYKKLVEENEKGNKGYYNVPFEIFSQVNIKPGDLYITGGYTSHGKSVFLRYLTYHYVVNCGLNAVFFTLEMDVSVVKKSFAVMHANNKTIFPNTPKISYTKYKKGELSEEEEDFLHNVALPDLFQNESYGILKIYKSNKIRFNLDDLRIVLRETQLMMTVDILSVDYLSLLYPLSDSVKRSPQTDDYNQMIKEFKQLLLTNIDGKNNKYPLIGLTAAQISRQGFQECLKSQKQYSISAFAMFNEIERSADILQTVLRDPELAQTNRIKLQFLKNRDGEVPYEGRDFVCNVDLGGLILDAKEQQIENLNELLKEFDLDV